MFGEHDTYPSANVSNLAQANVSFWRIIVAVTPRRGELAKGAIARVVRSTAVDRSGSLGPFSLGDANFHI